MNEKALLTRFTLLLLVVLLGGAAHLAAQEKVEARGITSVVKLEEVRQHWPAVHVALANAPFAVLH